LELVERNLDWVDDFHEALRPYTSDRCYQNFIDERQQDYLHAYYGENLQRLVMIKQKYDPDNAFHYPQSIPTTLPQDRTSEKHQPQGREGTAFRLWRSAQ
jgi:FAD/FMN-containing dehydrogenase